MVNRALLWLWHTSSSPQHTPLPQSQGKPTKHPSSGKPEACHQWEEGAWLRPPERDTLHWLPGHEQASCRSLLLAKAPSSTLADKAADTHAVAAPTERIKTLPTFLMMDGKEAASVASEKDGENEGGMQEEREAGGAEKSSQKWWIWLWGERRGVEPDLLLLCCLRFRRVAQTGNSRILWTT